MIEPIDSPSVRTAIERCAAELLADGVQVAHIEILLTGVHAARPDLAPLGVRRLNVPFHHTSLRSSNG